MVLRKRLMHLPQWFPEEQQTDQEKSPTNQNKVLTFCYRTKLGWIRRALLCTRSHNVTHLCVFTSLTNLGLVCIGDLRLLTATDKNKRMSLLKPGDWSCSWY